MDKNIIKKESISVCIGLFICYTLFIVCDIFFKEVTYGYYYYYTYTCIFTVFFGIVVYTLCFALVKSTFRATVICYTLIFIINIINELKIVYSGEPLYFSDIKFLGSSLDLLKLILGNFSFKFALKFLIISAVYLEILILIMLVNLKFNFELTNKKIRKIIIIVDIIILLLLFFPNNYTKQLYLKIFFNNDEYVDFDSYTNNLSFYARNGLINGMYGVVLNNIFSEPENYDNDYLESLLIDYENSNTNEEDKKFGKPNIIIWASESFWDIDQLTEVQFDKKITSNFNELKSNGKFINLITPTYGGMSENVMFELLTGGSMNYFSKGYIPIMSLYSRKNSTQIPSLVNVLKNNGYRTEIIFAKDYYNSENAFLNMGFNDYNELLNDNKETFSDKDCTDLIIKKLNEKTNQPVLYVLETIESHMPYSKEKYNEYDISIVDTNLDNSMNETLRSYAQGIYNADKELGVLYEYIQSYEEPTILLFFGDHLPLLYTEDKENVINELEYFNTEDTLLNNYRLYNTQALLLANFDIDDLDMPSYLGNDLLFNYLVNQLEIENEEFYLWLYDTTDILPASNNYISLDKNGNIYSTNELEGKMKEIYDIRELMQYKFFIH